ncbi:endonuclease MutS2 [Erysipelotrichaceae bacterium OttesenSCG-928-M19]|nr:endonuclease MutS2 [Erysipelotrichaceae bacterium OttesenSCG-928-M19]
MHNKVYQKLEFDEILNQVATKAQLQSTKEKIVSMQHSTNYDNVIEALNNTDEIMKLFLSYNEYSLVGLKDILVYFNNIAQNNILSGLELNEIIEQEETIVSLKNYYKDIDNKEEYEYFKDKIERLVSIKAITKEVKAMINYQGLVYEDATANLIHINSEISQTNQKITVYLRDFIKNNSEHLMDNVITFRNNRAVVMVKMASKNTIKGIIHDESSSKQTVFIEPSRVVELNNYLQSLEYQKNEEINIVLQELTNLVKENEDLILSNFSILTTLDLIKAKAAYSLEIDGNIPTINKDSAKLEIFAGRHPLIPQDDVIANDFFICNNETKYRIVLLSGSNTGGKTVALKMVGLFSLMAQSGLAISAAEKSNLPIYSEIFVDIGDEQSISESLSTFSSHLTNVSHITKNVSKYSLVLLDELGSGTDPRQGENLALAILEYLYKKDASVIVTTHYSKLKNYALTNNHVRSASVVFDEQSSRPIYKISFDTFASSNAFEIAHYLGLDDEIIMQARKYYNDDLNTSDELLLKLQAQQQDVELQQNALELEISKYQELNNKIKETEVKALEKNERILVKAKEEANQIINTSKEQAQIIIDKLKEQDNFINHKVNELNKEFDTLYFDETTKIDNDNQIFNVDDLVEIIKIKRQGVITKVLPKKNYEVAIGNIKTKVKHNEIKYLSKKPKEEVKKIKQKKHTSKQVKTELNLIGLRVEEALIELNRYLDDALLANLNQVRIVHGFGTGALRKAVHETLGSNKHVAKYYFAEYNEGGQGATIVELK